MDDVEELARAIVRLDCVVAFVGTHLHDRRPIIRNGLLAVGIDQQQIPSVRS
jgi:hypothetical protein